MRPLTSPIARPSDPATSHEAAQRITETGKRLTDADRCLDVVRHHPGLTAAEIGRDTLLGHIAAQRRLSDLKNAGAVRQGQARECSVNGTRMMTWWPPAPRQGVLI